MSTKQLEQRLAKLEAELDELKAGLQYATAKGWHAIVGTHEGSESFEVVVREMRRLRRKEYAEAAESGGESEA